MTGMPKKISTSFSVSNPQPTRIPHCVLSLPHLLVQETKSQHPLPNLCFSAKFRVNRKTKMATVASYCRYFSTTSLQPLNRIQRNFKGSKISTSSTMFVFSGRPENQDGHHRVWLADNFFVFSLHILYNVCVFSADRKSKMAALASDWLKHFLLLLCNCWTEFDENLWDSWTLRDIINF